MIVVLQKVERCLHIVDDHLGRVSCAQHLVSPIHQDDAVAIERTVPTAHTQAIRNDVWVVMVHASRGSEDNALVLHLMADIIVQARVATLGMSHQVTRTQTHEHIKHNKTYQKPDYLANKLLHLA